MDSRSQETKLRNEIQYLTRLIAAHKAIKSLQTVEEPTTAKITDKDGNKTLYRNKSHHCRSVAAPSWTYPGSISSHSLPTSSSSKKTSLLFLSSSSSSSSSHSVPPKLIPIKQDASVLNDSVQSMETSLIEGASPLLPVATKKKDSPKRIIIVSQVKKQEEDQRERIEGVSTSLPLATKKASERVVIERTVGKKRLIGERDKSERVIGGGRLKKIKLGLSPSPSVVQNNNRIVVWNNKQSKSSKRQFNKPDTSQLKWSRQENAILSDGVTKVTKATAPIPMPSLLSRKRRRSSSGGDGRVSGCGFNRSPFIIKRYQLLRITSATKSPSFSQRRLHYIKQQSCHSPFHSYSKKRRLSSSALTPPVAAATKRKSIHRVWAPGGQKAKSSRPSGLEVKTRQGNKQWLSAQLVKEKKQIMNRPPKARHLAKTQQVCGATPKRLKRKVLQVSIRGNSYLMSRNGKSMRRLSNSSKSFKSITTGAVLHKTLSKSAALKLVRANQVVQKSANRVWSAKRNGPDSIMTQYCVFYNRFGRCNRGEKCHYVHDPKRIAICSKFLRGKCDNIDGSCPFSHKISKEKMPVCSFFLRGVCTRDNCPYLHVSVGPDAELCGEFIKGYCPLGENCKKQHTLTCPDYSKTGTCPRGKRRCPLKHWRNPLKQYQTNTSTSTVCSSNPTVSSTAPGGVPAVKEPYPLKRLRLKSQKAQSMQPSSSSSSPTVITPYQLDFIPLDTSKDTGAPEVMYLRSGSVAKLRELKLIKDITGVLSFRLMGTLFNQKEMASLDQPFASALPIHFEEASIRGDPRINLLGLPGIQLLKFRMEL